MAFLYWEQMANASNYCDVGTSFAKAAGSHGCIQVVAILAIAPSVDKILGRHHDPAFHHHGDPCRQLPDPSLLERLKRLRSPRQIEAPPTGGTT